MRNNMTTEDGLNSTVTISIFSKDYYLPYEQLAEATFLILNASTGLTLNLLIALSIFCCKPLRKVTNGFIVHACLLDAFKSSVCIPFALSLLDVMTPDGCVGLGLAYIIALTVGMFNLLAIVMTEAYAFYEENINEPVDGNRGHLMCIVFGLVTIYIGSIILHLGPTFIGGELHHNPSIGNCMFAYGKIKNYIVHVIWIIIVTLTLLVIFYYIYKFYRLLTANERFRITNLARNAAAYSKGYKPNETIYDTITRLKKKVKVFLCMTFLYFFCWYPLFILTVTDYTYERPYFVYRIFTVIAWSHSTLVPVTLIIMDDTFGIVPRVIRVWRSRTTSTISQQAHPSSRESLATNNAHSHQHDKNGSSVNTRAVRKLQAKYVPPPTAKDKIKEKPYLNSSNTNSTKELSEAEMAVLISKTLSLEDSVV